ncbi:MAG: hypothetical protein ACTS53_02125 [Candidatus Hodgkinia cicadicola]
MFVTFVTFALTDGCGGPRSITEGERVSGNRSTHLPPFNLR